MFKTKQRKLHLSFCKQCINRKHTFENGLICGVTDMSADFNDNCSDYQQDKRQLDFLKNEFEQEIKEEYPKSGIKGALSQFEFQRVPMVLFKKFETREKTHGFEISKDNKYDKGLLGMVWFLIALLVWGNSKNDYSWDLSSANVIGILILFIVQFYFIYKGYFYKYPTLIMIQEKGIDQKDNYIFWTDILDYGLLQGKGKRSSEKYVIIGTISSGIIKIDLTNTNISQLQFIEILQHHRNVSYMPVL